MTIKEKVRQLIVQKTLILFFIAILLTFFCYLSTKIEQVSDKMKLIYLLLTILGSILILIYIAKKIGYFRLVLGKEWTATVVAVYDENMTSSTLKLLGIGQGIHEINVVRISFLIDGHKKKKSLIFPKDKIGMNIYQTGDRIHFIKGTRYPINLTREVEQHICPFCGHDGFEDECPNCKIIF